MSIPANSGSAQVKLVLAWGEGFVKKDMDIITKSLHKDFRYTPYPRSLGLPEQTREEWIAQFTQIISLWTEVNSTTNSIIEAPGTVIVHFTNKIKTSLGIETTREAISIAHIVTDEDGSLKIKQIEDFADSKSHFDFMQAIAAVTQKK